MISSVSYPRSASSASASMPLIRWIASLQSARVPSVTIIRTGIPCASTARCIFELSPLLCAPCLGYPFCSCPVLMDFNIGSVNHQPFKIRFINKDFKKLFPKPIVPSSAKSAMCVFPVAIFRWQVAPWRTSS